MSGLFTAVLQNQPIPYVVGRPQVGQHLFIVGHPHVVGQYPHVVGQYPHVVGQYPPNVGQYPPVNFNSAIGTIGIGTNSPYTSSSSSSYSASQAEIEKRQNNDYYGDNPLGWFRN